MGAIQKLNGNDALNAPLASPTFTGTVIAPLLEGGTSTTSTLTYRTTSGVGATGADHIFQVGNNGATEAMRILNNGNIGIGSTAPGSLLDIGLAGTTLGTMRLEGNTSGYVQVQPAAAAGSWTMTLPTSAGTNGYVLTTNGSGVTSWAAGGGAPALSAVTAATATNTLANANFAQTWNWDTLTTGAGMKMAVGGTTVTSGGVLTLENIRSNAASVGNVLTLNTTGAANAAVPLMITNAGTGLSLRVNDDGTAGDTTPFVVDAAGNVGIGTTAPGYLLDVAGDWRFSLSGGQTIVMGGIRGFFESYSGGWAAGYFAVGSSTSNTVDTALTAASMASGGVPSVGSGTAISLQGYLNANYRDMGAVSSVWTNASFATRSADLYFSTVTNGGALTERMRLSAAGYMGIGTTSPGSLRDLGLAGTTLGTMRFEGNTSGYVHVQPAAAAGSWTMTLPTSAGTNGYVLTTNGSGVASWSAAGGAATLSSLAAATATNILANGNFAQTWNWDTLTTGTGMKMAAGGTTVTSVVEMSKAGL